MRTEVRRLISKMNDLRATILDLEEELAVAEEFEETEKLLLQLKEYRSELKEVREKLEKLPTTYMEIDHSKQDYLDGGNK